MSDSGESQGLLVGFSGKPDVLLWSRANRHGLVAGATGTGKTITLQVLAQAFSDAGVPVFAADIKGDLSGISAPGSPNEKLLKRAETVGITLEAAGSPCIFWDLFGQSGHPIRTTVSEMGPLLLSRLFELNDVQEGVLSIAFHVADKEGLLLLDLDDLRALLNHVGKNAAEISRTYGQVSQASIGAIQRQILQLETQGGDQLFGEPALRLEDFLRNDIRGKGYINLLSAEKLINNPRLYSTFLLWLLSELFEQLPEVGDPEKPRVVFFFDEAHLLFREAPKALLEKVEQVVRLIRSKGVGIYFVTQNPADIPDAVLAQLGNRIQHALRAYTPSEQKGLKAAANSFRPNPDFDTAEKIQTLGVGEAVVSLLDAKGIPGMAAHCLIRPPASRLGPITAEERKAHMAASPVGALYNTPVNRESAYEILSRRAEAAELAEKATQEAQTVETKAPAPKTKTRSEPAPARSQRQGAFEALAVSLLRTVGNQVGREIVRGVMGSLKKRR